MLSGLQRSKNMLGRVRMLLGQSDDTVITNDTIYYSLFEKERDIAETYLCVEASLTFSVISGTSSYDLTLDGSGNQTGFYRQKIIKPPTTSRVTVFEKDNNEFDFIKRYTRTSVGLPIWFANIWNGTLSFYPTPSANETWTIDFYKSPVNMLSKTQAPETPSAFDTALVYGACMELSPLAGKAEAVESYLMLYEKEKQRALESYRGTVTLSKIITYQDL